jgi:hypothetical protein
VEKGDGFRDPAGARPVADRAGIIQEQHDCCGRRSKPWQKRPRFSPPIGGSSASLAPSTLGGGKESIPSSSIDSLSKANSSRSSILLLDHSQPKV